MRWIFVWEHVICTWAGLGICVLPRLVGRCRAFYYNFKTRRAEPEKGLKQCIFCLLSDILHRCP